MNIEVKANNIPRLPGRYLSQHPEDTTETFTMCNLVNRNGKIYDLLSDGTYWDVGKYPEILWSDRITVSRA